MDHHDWKPRTRPWGRRARDRGVKCLLALLSAACLGLMAELGTGLGRWLWGMVWHWLVPVKGM